MYLRDDIVLIHLTVKAGLDMCVVQTGEDLHIARQDALGDLRDFIHVHLALRHLLTVEDMNIRFVQQVLHEIVLVKTEHAESQGMNRTVGFLRSDIEHLAVVRHAQQGKLTDDPHEALLVEVKRQTVGVAVLHQDEVLQGAEGLLRFEDLVNGLLGLPLVGSHLHGQGLDLVIQEEGKVMGQQEQVHLVLLRDSVYRREELPHPFPVLALIYRYVETEVQRR